MIDAISFGVVQHPSYLIPKGPLRDERSHCKDTTVVVYDNWTRMLGRAVRRSSSNLRMEWSGTNSGLRDADVIMQNKIKSRVYPIAKRDLVERNQP